jgi:2-polyprenyl-3-methyl-5-hydroxy-6-metoxy-1,4-benzoquinol methylase
MLTKCSLDVGFLEEYHRSPSEQSRTADLLRLIPSGYETALDAGARDSFYSTLIAERFASVTSFDLIKPPLTMDRVHCVEGDITHLNDPDRKFDVVLCTDVLEHLPGSGKGKR